MLTKNKRVLDDIKKYQDSISKITDENTKTELKKLLNLLISEIKKIDSYHSEVSIRNNIGHVVSESRNNIISIRKKIERKISDSEKSDFTEKQCS